MSVKFTKYDSKITEVQIFLGTLKCRNFKGYGILLLLKFRYNLLLSWTNLKLDHLSSK